MPGVLGPVIDKQILLGYEVTSFVMTVNGSPTGGTIALKYGRERSTSWAYNAAASTVQTAIRTITPLAAATVSGNSGGPWTVTCNATDVAIVLDLEIINEMTGGTTPYVAVTRTEAGILLPLKTPITSAVIPPLAGKTFIPGTSSERASQVKVSQYVIEPPLRLGRRELRESERVDEVAETNCWTFADQWVTLGPLVQNTSASISDTIFPIRAYLWDGSRLNLFGWRAYAYYTSNGTTFSTRAGIPFPGQAVTFYKSYGYISDPSGYAYWTGTAAGTEADFPAGDGGERTVVGWAVWDNKLFALCNNGRIKYTVSEPATDGTSTYWTDMGVMIPDGTGIGMVVFAGADGQEAIHILTTLGMYALDFGSQKVRPVYTHAAGFVGTSITSTNITRFPTAQNVVVWNGEVYYTLARQVYAWDGGTVRNVSPFREDGLPSSSYVFQYATVPFGLFPLGRWLLMAMGSRTTQGAGFVLAYDGRDWFMLVPPQNGDGTSTSRYAPWAVGFFPYFTTGGVDQSRVFFGNGDSIYFPDGDKNPVYFDIVEYAASGTMITPWFDRGLAEIDKAAYNIDLRVSGISADETIKVYYQIDGAPDSTSTNTGNDPRKQWVQLLDEDGSAATVNSTYLSGASSGVARLYFDRQTAIDGSTKFSKGVRFTKLRLRFDLARGSTVTLSPRLEAAVVNLDAQFDSLRGWNALIDLEGDLPMTAERALATIRTLADSRTLVPFTDNPFSHYLVHVDSFETFDTATGGVITAGSNTPYVRLVLSERLRD